MTNLCRPDHLKSCAACCGLYNVRDARRPTLTRKLERRTRLFSAVDRTPEAIERFAEHISQTEADPPLDPEIHVCEFTGFVDSNGKSVGCMLHPDAPGNAGVDLRGLCHYGSLACRSFFCPACEALPQRYAQIVIALVDDWHLYGLAITDVDFVISLFGLIEHRLSHTLDPDLIPPVRELLRGMLCWKSSWPFGGPSSLRRSRYYFKQSVSEAGPDPDRYRAAMLDALTFTYDVPCATADAMRLIDENVDAVVAAYYGNS